MKDVGALLIAGNPASEVAAQDTILGEAYAISARKSGLEDLGADQLKTKRRCEGDLTIV